MILISCFSEFPKEDEVLLPPNTLLKVCGEVLQGSKELIGRQIGITPSKMFLCEVRDATPEDIDHHKGARTTNVLKLFTLFYTSEGL